MMTLDEVRDAAETGEVIEARLSLNVRVPSIILLVGSPTSDGYTLVEVESTYPNGERHCLVRALHELRKVPK